MIFAIEKVKFLHGAGEVTLSGGRLVGVSVAIALPVENGCMVDRSVYVKIERRLRDPNTAIRSSC